MSSMFFKGTDRLNHIYKFIDKVMSLDTERLHKEAAQLIWLKLSLAKLIKMAEHNYSVITLRTMEWGISGCDYLYSTYKLVQFISDNLDGKAQSEELYYKNRTLVEEVAILFIRLSGYRDSQWWGKGKVPTPKVDYLSLLQETYSIGCKRCIDFTTPEFAQCVKWCHQMMEMSRVYVTRVAYKQLKNPKNDIQGFLQKRFKIFFASNGLGRISFNLDESTYDRVKDSFKSAISLVYKQEKSGSNVVTITEPYQIYLAFLRGLGLPDSGRMEEVTRMFKTPSFVDTDTFDIVYQF
jgi:hypothetical protein